MPVGEQELVHSLLRERRKLIAYIWSIVRDPHTAEDVFQEVSLIAVQKRDDIERQESILPWLRAVARHKAVKARELGSRRPVPLDAALLAELEVVWARRDSIASYDLSMALEDCTSKLNHKARQIVGMRYGGGMCGQEVADAMGIQVRSVYKALSRIHVTLADCVTRELRHHAN
jgi:RNA polymerase sigma-70 factor (ECF subfamily)